MKRRYYWVIPFVLITAIGWKIMVDINSLPQDSSPVSSTDFVMSYDASAGQNKKVLMDDLPSSGLANVVEDLTPQLGGDLDVNSKNIDFPTTTNISDCLDEDNMVSDSATKLATQQSIKAYADSVAGGGWTDSAPHVTVTDTTDNVSIGTATANAKLDVQGTAIFNDDGADVDFRVEGNTNANLIFADAGNDRVGINNATPATALDVTGTITASTDIKFRKAIGTGADGDHAVNVANSNNKTTVVEGDLWYNKATDLLTVATDTTVANSYELVGTDTTQTLIKKTYNANGTGNVLSNVDEDNCLNASDLVRGAIEFIVGSDTAITSGIKGDVEIPYNCTIIRGTILLDQVGTMTVGLWVDTFANYPPTSADSIVADAPLTTAGTIKGQDSTLTGWTTSLTAGSIIRYNVDDAGTATRGLISLIVEK